MKILRVLIAVMLVMMLSACDSEKQPLSSLMPKHLQRSYLRVMLHRFMTHTALLMR